MGRQLGYVDSLSDLLNWSAGAIVSSESSWRPITKEEDFPGFNVAWDVCNDESSAQVWFCSRRAAKTSTAIRRTVKRSSERRGWRTLYIHRTRPLAKQQFFETGESVGPEANPGVMELLKSHGIREAKHDMTELWVRLENGSLIQVVGCDDIRDVDKKLGFRWNDILIDECQDHDNDILVRLVEKTILPTLIDRGGSLTLMGTPAEMEAGFWYKTYSSEESTFRRHNWSMLENPFIQRAKIIEAMGKAGYVIDFDDPTNNAALIQREIFGLHCIDPDGLMYPYRKGFDFNDYPETGIPMLDAKSWRYAMGVDIGGPEEHNDDDAIVVWGWRMDDPGKYIYERESWRGHGDSNDFLSRVLETFLRWQPMQSLCLDTGGAGATKMIAALRPRLGGLETAPKPTDVKTSQRLIGDELRSRRMRLDPNGEIAKAAKSCRKGQHEDDVMAAARYAFHGAVNWLAKETTKKEETYEQYLERNIIERQRRRQAGIRGMWGHPRAHAGR